jgi:hypothetical protein
VNEKVLIACEFSGIVRDAFIARGFDAVSIDLLPTDRPGPHIQGDIRHIYTNDFELMIAHPPCTYIANSGVTWLHQDPERWELMREGAEFFKYLLDKDIPHVAVENPIMHKYAVEIVGRRQDQIVQPWMFGHAESKATGFWLNNLPPLRPTENVLHLKQWKEEREWQRLHYLPPTEDRAKLRSITYRGIAKAMADQWGSHLRWRKMQWNRKVWY